MVDGCTVVVYTQWIVLKLNQKNVVHMADGNMWWCIVKSVVVVQGFVDNMVDINIIVKSVVVQVFVNMVDINIIVKNVVVFT